jgi:hypothetical protein
MKNCVAFLIAVGCASGLAAQTIWAGYGRDAQHTGLSSIGGKPLTRQRWSHPVDELLQNTSGTLHIHFASPSITAANTMLIPVRTATGDFRVDAVDAATGNSKYSLSSTPAYVQPDHDWIPSFPTALTARNRFYFAGPGGTVYYRDTPDSNTGVSGQIAFYGNAAYAADSAALNNSVMISTPITADRYGNIFFGFVVTQANSANLTSGLARISYSGVGSWVSATMAAADASVNKLQTNGAPALSVDGTIVYFVANAGSGGGDLVSVNATTLTPIAHVRLSDPSTSTDALVNDNSSAAPTVGPDGDVYIGVLESGGCCAHNVRGWLLHFDRTLSQSKIPGSFGWDTTASIVPAALVPSYHGVSSYLLFTKYNNYKDFGEDGRNRVAVLDPKASMPDPLASTSSVQVMQEVITILAPTPDGPPATAVREWCINSAAIDIPNKSAIVNNEDGVLYRWDFTTNTLSQQIRLTQGVGEAYTPTLIGPDGTVYAINDAILFAIGQ